MSSDIEKRKADHIDLCATGDVGFLSKGTLFDDVELIHDSLPELRVDDIDTSVTLFGKKLRAPIVIASMTGGTEKAQAINLELARLAGELGIGFGLGSQRPMLRDGRERDASYAVRKVAPDVLLLGNLGAVQARLAGLDAVRDLVSRVGADALCLHLNPAQEIVQPEGDRDFTGVVSTLEAFGEGLSIPVLAKETGCGIGPSAARKIASAGIRHIDVSGAGGTSWVAVEMHRSTGNMQALGAAFREWGVPTAASVIVARAARPKFSSIIATGGMQSGIDLAKALALGAIAGGFARPVLQAFTAGGIEGARAFLERIRSELVACMLLTGSKSVADLSRGVHLLGPRLTRWDKLAKRHRKGPRAR